MLTELYHINSFQIFIEKKPILPSRRGPWKQTKHKGRRPLHCREFPEISIQTHAFERLCHSLLREQQQNEFAVNHCGTATNHYKNKEFNHT